MDHEDPPTILTADARVRIDEVMSDAAPARRPADGVVIRPAEPRDTAAAWAVERAAFAETDRFSLRQTAGLITNPRGRVFVAEDNGDIVGWIAMLTRRNRSGRSGRMYTVAVSPTQAGRGLGRRLAVHAVGTLDAEGVKRIYLEVRAENARAIALYESLGFRVVRHLPTYYGEDSPGLRMVRQRPEH